MCFPAMCSQYLLPYKDNLTPLTTCWVPYHVLCIESMHFFTMSTAALGPHREYERRPNAGSALTAWGNKKSNDILFACSRNAHKPFGF